MMEIDFTTKPKEIICYYKDIHGNECTYDEHGRLHSYHDQPSVKRGEAFKEWHRHGKYHRDNGEPAVIWPDGEVYWFFDNKLHRQNGLPAVIMTSGRKQYWENGKRKNSLFAFLKRKFYKVQND